MPAPSSQGNKCDKLWLLNAHRIKACRGGGEGVELPANRLVIPLNNVLTVINLVLSVGVANPAWTSASSVLSNSSLFLGGCSAASPIVISC